jgi:osmoprotectant transport system substrate-binding protein
MAALRSLGALASLLAALTLVACDGHRDRGVDTLPSGPIAPSEANARTPVVVGATRRPEQRILANVDAEGLRAAGFTVRVHGGLTGPREALTAVSEGRIDVYPEFADLALAGLDAPPGAPTLDRLRTRLGDRNAVAVPGAAASRSYGVVVTAARARKLHLDNVSDLGKRSPVLLAGPRGCQRLPHCLPALRRAYGDGFARFHAVRPDLVHEALRTGRAMGSIVSTDDPHIARGGEALLNDDRRAFPLSPVAVVLENRAARRGGAALRGALERAGAALTLPVLEELNARVQFDELPPSRVAAEYLRGAHIVGGDSRVRPRHLAVSTAVISHQSLVISH